MNQDTSYKDALTNAMTFLAEQSDTIFIGQQTLYPGNPMSTTLGNVPKNKIIELPVMEDSQMGMSLGMAFSLTGSPFNCCHVCTVRTKCITNINLKRCVCC